MNIPDRILPEGPLSKLNEQNKPVETKITSDQLHKIVKSASKASPEMLKSLTEAEHEIIKTATNSLEDKENITVIDKDRIFKLLNKLEGSSELNVKIENTAKPIIQTKESPEKAQVLTEKNDPKDGIKRLKADILKNADHEIVHGDYKKGVKLLRDAAVDNFNDDDILLALARAYVNCPSEHKDKADKYLYRAQSIYEELSSRSDNDDVLEEADKIVNRVSYNTINSHATQIPESKELMELQKVIDDKQYIMKLNTRTLIPDRSNKPNPQWAKRWVELHKDPDCKKAAQALVDHTKHVSFNTFQLELGNAISQFKKQLKTDEKYIVVLSDDKGKSDKWALELGLPLLMDHLPYEVVGRKGLKEYLSTNSDVTKVLFLDDASYSGHQMAGWVKEQQKNSPEVEAHVVIPYMTDRAQKLIQDTSPNAKIYCTQKMNSIKEDISDENIQNTLTSMYFNEDSSMHEKGVEMRTLTIFDHKIADCVSTAEVAYNGEVRNKDGTMARLPEWTRTLFPNNFRWIPSTNSPYKMRGIES